jgi:hypothetical protein
MPINIQAEFEKLDDVNPKFKDIANKLSSRPDIHALILLNQLTPGDSDMVSAAEHDQIWLDVEIDKLALVVTVEQLEELYACGVYYDPDVESLFMFV